MPYMLIFLKWHTELTGKLWGWFNVRSNPKVFLNLRNAWTPHLTSHAVTFRTYNELEKIWPKNDNQDCSTDFAYITTVGIDESPVTTLTPIYTNWELKPYLSPSKFCLCDTREKMLKIPSPYSTAFGNIIQSTCVRLNSLSSLPKIIHDAYPNIS